MSTISQRSRTPIRFVKFVTIGIGVGGLFLVALRLEHFRSTALPTPTGTYAVGRARWEWSDTNTVDSLAPAPRTKRELVAWVWYPAAPGPSIRSADYVPEPVRTAVNRARGHLIAGLLTRDLSRVRDNARQDAPVARDGGAYPVIIFRAGASAEVWNYAALIEDLASHGYVVVGFDAPYRTNVIVFGDGRVARRAAANNPELALGAPDSAARISKVLAAWTRDVGFALDRLQDMNSGASPALLAGRLDLERVGVIGHSFGGATAAEFCAEDTRCKAGIDIDGAPLGRALVDGIHRPFMLVLSDHGAFADPADQAVMANIRTVYAGLPAHQRFLVEIHGANHFLFSDDGALLKSQIVEGLLRVFGIVRMDGARQIAVTRYAVYSFFDAYIKSDSGREPTLSSSRLPELRELR